MEEVSTGIQIQVVPVGGQQRFQVHFHHALALIFFHGFLLRHDSLAHQGTLQIQLFTLLPVVLGFRPDLVAFFLAEVKGLYLFGLVQFHNPKPAVSSDIPQVTAVAVDGSNHDTLTRVAFHSPAVAGPELIVAG